MSPGILSPGWQQLSQEAVTEAGVWCSAVTAAAAASESQPASELLASLSGIFNL